MSSGIRTIVAMAATGLISFFAVLFILNMQFPGAVPSIRDVRVSAETLKGCVAGKGELAACRADARQLISSLDTVPSSGFDFRQEANFTVFVLDKFLILYKKSCGTKDLAVDEFHWRVWPADRSTLPKRWKSSGFAGGVQKFSKAGFNVGGTCLLVIRLPIDRLKSLEIGQYDRSARKWTWRVAAKV